MIRLMTNEPLTAPDLEDRLRKSWEANAEAWTSAVRESRIPSRNAGTNQAILSVVASLSKGRLLDVGCGEGWLARAAMEQGWNVIGIDASAALIERAKQISDARYFVIDYAQLTTDPNLAGNFECIVCNFSILGEEVRSLLTALRDLLRPGGALVIQTVHPWAACGEQPYRNGWREETFQGWSGGFTEPMPWFFRTLQSWFSELAGANLEVLRLEEPADPVSGRPLSIVMICKPAQ
jgi:2-polyprenyl-3-methyl-5-hydroxy-6-metoxy-1,4-benzoquinol methylase